MATSKTINKTSYQKLIAAAQELTVGIMPHIVDEPNEYKRRASVIDVMIGAASQITGNTDTKESLLQVAEQAIAMAEMKEAMRSDDEENK